VRLEGAERGGDARRGAPSPRVRDRRLLRQRPPHGAARLRPGLRRLARAAAPAEDRRLAPDPEERPGARPPPPRPARRAALSLRALHGPPLAVRAEIGRAHV